MNNFPQNLEVTEIELLSKRILVELNEKIRIYETNGLGTFCQINIRLIR